jgi:hypothetical protein
MLSVASREERRESREERTKAPITRPVAPSERLREERNMVSLSNWSLHSLTHRREIRSIASAFVGEIAAILHLIETHDVVAMAEKALDACDGTASLPNLTLPPFTIYTADAARLDELPLPAPRMIAYFYAQVASIQDDLARLSLSRTSRPPVEPSGYGTSSPSSMTRSLSAMIFFASCVRCFRRSIRGP